MYELIQTTGVKRKCFSIWCDGVEVARSLSLKMATSLFDSYTKLKKENYDLRLQLSNQLDQFSSEAERREDTSGESGDAEEAVKAAESDRVRKLNALRCTDLETEAYLRESAEAKRRSDALTEDYLRESAEAERRAAEESAEAERRHAATVAELFAGFDELERLSKQRKNIQSAIYRATTSINRGGRSLEVETIDIESQPF